MGLGSESIVTYEACPVFSGPRRRPATAWRGAIEPVAFGDFFATDVGDWPGRMAECRTGGHHQTDLRLASAARRERPMHLRARTNYRRYSWG